MKLVSNARAFSPAQSLQTPGRFDQYATFSPDGSEYYLSVTDSDWNYLGIMRSVRRHGRWSAFEPLPFAWGKGKDAGEPFVTPDGQSLLFVSAREGGPAVPTGIAGAQDHVRAVNVDIFVARRNGAGWGDPVRLAAPVNSQWNEWHPAVAADGTLYFASERGSRDGKADIYFARREMDGSYRKVERVPSPVNREDSNDSDPFIAPDKSYLLFHSDRAGGYGEHDLYISFAEPGGGWSQPRNLGAAVNSSGWEMGPFVTRDNRLFLFTRRQSITTVQPSRIYAVDARTVLRK